MYVSFIILCNFSIAQVDTCFTEKQIHQISETLDSLYYVDSVNNKLIYCLKGKIYLAIVNYNKQSEQYLQKFELEMDEDSNFAVFVPKNFLNGHYCLTEDCLFYYKWSENYVFPENQFSLRWDDPILDIKWPLIKTSPILSERDKKSKFLKEGD